jgi:hypothetical protein
MIRVSTLIWVMLVALSGYTMFQVKAEVGRLDRLLGATNRRIADDRAQIRTLNIEWATLTQPQRLDMLSQRVLQLTPIRTLVLGSLDQVPSRDGTESPAGTATAQIAEVSLKVRP